MHILLTAYLVMALVLWIDAAHRPAGRLSRRERHFGWRERTVLAAVGAVASLLWPVLAAVYGAGAAQARLRSSRRDPALVRLQLAARHQRTSHAS